MHFYLSCYHLIIPIILVIERFRGSIRKYYSTHFALQDQHKDALVKTIAKYTCVSRRILYVHFMKKIWSAELEEKNTEQKWLKQFT